MVLLLRQVAQGRFSTKFTKPLNLMVSKILDKLPLRTVLIVPFILQIVGAVGLVGYLSFRNGQKAVNNLASQLMSEVSLRVKQNLQAYVTTPHQINQSKLDAVLDRKSGSAGMPRPL